VARSLISGIRRNGCFSIEQSARQANQPGGVTWRRAPNISTDRITIVQALQRVNPTSAPAPKGKYSQLTIVAAGTRTATFAGQIATDASAGAAEQTRLVFAAIGELLASQGATPSDLIKLTTFVVGRDSLAEFNTARDKVYHEWFPEGDFPANTLVLVAGLAIESSLVEIEGSFVCQESGGQRRPG
ncbi:RidA family protein, partial [Actinoplanes palleronii]